MLFSLTWFIFNMPLLKLPKPVILLAGLLCLSSCLSLVSLVQLQKLSGGLEPEVKPAEVSQSPLFSEKIVVDIQGAVTRPGVYEIPEESRLLAALNSAEGLAEHADRYQIAKSFNLAKPLVDGEKIYIPSIGEESGNAQTNSLISINSAGETELELLPGVGPVTAAKIIERRPYSSLEDLVSRKALGEKTLEKIINLITL